jgi:hypothetical protein
VKKLSDLVERLAGDDSLLSTRSETLSDTIESNTDRLEVMDARLEREQEPGATSRPIRGIGIDNRDITREFGGSGRAANHPATDDFDTKIGRRTEGKLEHDLSSPRLVPQ